MDFDYCHHRNDCDWRRFNRFRYCKLYWFERIIAVITGLLLVYPEGISDIIGLIVFVVMVAIRVMGRNTSKGKMQEAN